jgi:hypothetical protein
MDARCYYGAAFQEDINPPDAMLHVYIHLSKSV